MMQCFRCAGPVGQRYYVQGGHRLCVECGQAAENPGLLERLTRLVRPGLDVDGPWSIGPASRPTPVCPGEPIQLVFRTISRANGMEFQEAQFSLAGRAFEMKAESESFSGGRLAELGDSRHEKGQTTSTWFPAEALYELSRTRSLQVSRRGDRIEGRGQRETTSPHGDYRAACRFDLHPETLTGNYREDSHLDVSQ